MRSYAYQDTRGVGGWGIQAEAICASIWVYARDGECGSMRAMLHRLLSIVAACVCVRARACAAMTVQQLSIVGSCSAARMHSSLGVIVCLCSCICRCLSFHLCLRLCLRLRLHICLYLCLCLCLCLLLYLSVCIFDISALRKYKYSLEHKITILGEEDPSVGWSKNNIGNAFKGLGGYCASESASSSRSSFIWRAGVSLFRAIRRAQLCEHHTEHK